MKIYDMFKVLEFGTLDTSDFILIATEIVKRSRPDSESLRKQLHDIRVQYLHQNYLAALKMLSQFDEIKLNVNNKISSLADGNSSKDVAEENQSRRFFETKLAQHGWSKLSDEHFKSIQKLSVFMGEYNTKYSSLPTTIGSRDDAEVVVSSIREYVERTDAFTEIAREVRTYKASLANTKDRGDKKVDPSVSSQGSASAKIGSSNPGIIKSLTPTPLDIHLSESRTNSLSDLFLIKRGVDRGFSYNSVYTPFVNSISGTTYDMATLLLQYVEKNESDPDLVSDVQNIVLAFLLFTCKEGYHSFREMIAVLNEDPLIKLLFLLSRTKLDGSSLECFVEVPFEASSLYALVLRQRIIMQKEFTEHKNPSITSLELEVRLSVEISENANTKEPQVYVGAIIQKIIPDAASGHPEVILSESKGTTELFSFIKIHLPKLSLKSPGGFIPLNDFLKPSIYGVEGRAELVKIPLVNSFNFKDDEGKLLKPRDIRFVKKLAKLCNHQGEVFNIRVSLDAFNLPSKSKVWGHDGVELQTNHGKIELIRLDKMVGDADSKLSLIVAPENIAEIRAILKDALGEYEGWATPSGPVPPYFTLCEANLDEKIDVNRLKKPIEKPKNGL